MSDKILTISDIQKIVKPLAEKNHISEVYLFGSYARNEAAILIFLFSAERISG